jgi:type III pantothenate kinase
MHLLIDVGNSRIKWRLVADVYNLDEISHYGLLADLASFIKTLDASRIQVLLAAVNQTSDLKKLLFESHFKGVNVAHSQLSQSGLHNSYSHPERMGVDRWLAMIAAYAEIKKSNKLRGFIVVDAGSALTIDIVNATGKHLGGYIVPGLHMSQQALFANTERVIQYDEALADSHQYNKYKALGNNTVQCVEYGAMNQMAALVKQVKEEYLNYEIFFTGGDGELLASFLKAGTVDKDLVLKGLWQVRN